MTRVVGPVGERDEGSEGLHFGSRPSPGWRDGWLPGGPRSLIPLWKPLAVLIAARLFMGIGLYIYQHVTRSFVVNNWDGGWYVYAAQHGWPHHVLPGFNAKGQDTLAFFPGLPFLIRIVHFVLPVSWLRAGEVAAFLTQVAMVWGVWLLARDVWGDAVADRSVVLLCFFPGAFVLAIMYSEPLLIAASAFCILALRHQRWWLAGIFGAIATATRVTGLALLLCCAWEAYVAIRADRRWISLVSVLLTPAGIVGWFLYLWALTGARLAWLDTERHGWGQHTTVMAIPHLITAVLHHRPANMNEVLPLAGTVLALVMLGMLLQSRAPAVLSIFSIAVLVESATSVNPSGIRFRFVMTAFPLLMVVAYRLKETAFSVAVAGSAVVLSAIMVVTLTGATLIP